MFRTHKHSSSSKLTHHKQLFSPKNKEHILDYWKKNRYFEEANELSKENEMYVLYVNTPFATDLPHFRHILSCTTKDCVGRYFNMRGYHVERRFGWDCHELPVEYEIDKMLTITTREQLLEMRIKAYNEKCMEIAQKYTNEGKQLQAEWKDESTSEVNTKQWTLVHGSQVWLIFKQIFKEDKFYRGSESCHSAQRVKHYRQS